MQTLTAGSFLNLENAGSVEALKFTARRLAEHTTTVIAENLTAEALKKLANDLWQKAEYVARETERRRLHEIFDENFCERFRELKPEVSRAETANLEVQQNISTVGDDNSTAQQLPATVESVSMPDLPKESATVAEEKKDEFLGFVNSSDSFAVSPATETNAATTTTAMPTAQEGEPVAGEKVSPDNLTEIEPQPTAAPVADAKDNPPPASAVKTSATAPKTSDAKEPFEFGKCTVNLSLVLLPSSGNSKSRKLIVSAASHNLPPEIEFLEIEEGEDLAEIATLVKGKLERFTQTLPAKYIEQLRASKTKSAKKPATSKPAATIAAQTNPEVVQTNGAKTNGSQPAQSERATETEKTKVEVTATKENLAAQTAPVAPLPQPHITSANNVQPSLF